MTIPQALAMGAVQGLTEFLPVSSSAHLYVVPKLMGWPYPGIGFDVALHWGTLLALVVSFGSTWAKLFRDAFSSDHAVAHEARQTWLKIVVASIPTAVAGVLLRHAAETALRNLPIQAIMLFVFGMLLWWVDRVSPQSDYRLVPGWRTSVLVGFAQVLSLVPGVSRSGITITAGRAARESRVTAARFSFLLAAPITLGAGLLEIRNLRGDIGPGVLFAGIASSTIVGWLAIRGLLRWLGRGGFGGFFLYRTLLAVVIVIHLVQSRPASAGAFPLRQAFREVAVEPVAQENARTVKSRLHRRDG